MHWDQILAYTLTQTTQALSELQPETDTDADTGHTGHPSVHAETDTQTHPNGRT
jgi:hypothetical protein